MALANIAANIGSLMGLIAGSVVFFSVVAGVIGKLTSAGSYQGNNKFLKKAQDFIELGYYEEALTSLKEIWLIGSDFTSEKQAIAKFRIAYKALDIKFPQAEQYITLMNEYKHICKSTQLEGTNKNKRLEEIQNSIKEITKTLPDPAMEAFLNNPEKRLDLIFSSPDRSLRALSLGEAIFHAYWVEKKADSIKKRLDGIKFSEDNLIVLHEGLYWHVKDFASGYLLVLKVMLLLAFLLGFGMFKINTFENAIGYIIGFIVIFIIDWKCRKVPLDAPAKQIYEDILGRELLLDGLGSIPQQSKTIILFQISIFIIAILGIIIR